MADKEDWRRRREREDEEEREEELKKEKESPSFSSGVSSEKLVELLERADVLIEQLTHLYNMYFAGAERLPPVEKRKQLDQIMLSVTYAAKPTPSLLFKCNGMVSRYSTHKEKWDRMIKDLESGKIKRVAGPKSTNIKRSA